jgi:hypothetical protein
LVKVRLGVGVRVVGGPEAVTADGAVEAVAVPSVSVVPGVVPTVVPTVVPAAVVPTVVPAVVPTVESAAVVPVVVSGLPARIVAAATPAAKTPPKTHNNASRRRIGSQYHQPTAPLRRQTTCAVTPLLVRPALPELGETSRRPDNHDKDRGLLAHVRLRRLA